MGLLTILASPAAGIVLAGFGALMCYVGARNPDRLAARKMQEAIAAHEGGCDDEAIGLALEAKGFRPEHLGATYLIGRLLVNAERHGDAISHLEEAQRLGADPGLIAQSLGLAYHRAGRSEEAIAILQRLPEDHPGFIQALILLAAIFQETGRAELSIQALERAPLGKRNLTPELVAVHYALGVLYQDAGNRKKAMQHLRRVCAQDAAFEDAAERLETLTSSGG